MGEGLLYNFIFTELPFKAISGDVTAFHRILLPHSLRELRSISIFNRLFTDFIIIGLYNTYKSNVRAIHDVVL